MPCTAVISGTLGTCPSVDASLATASEELEWPLTEAPEDGAPTTPDGATAKPFEDGTGGGAMDDMVRVKFSRVCFPSLWVADIFQ